MTVLMFWVFLSYAKGIKGHRRKIYISPHTFLVGYTGKIRCDNRLMPLCMSQKYKSFLEQQESERNEKVINFAEVE